MDNSNQNQSSNSQAPKKTRQQYDEENRQGPMVYLLGIIVVAVVAVGYMIYKNLGYL